MLHCCHIVPVIHIEAINKYEFIIELILTAIEFILPCGVVITVNYRYFLSKEQNQLIIIRSRHYILSAKGNLSKMLFNQSILYTFIIVPCTSESFTTKS